MAGLQRSAISFRRQGSSGSVWDDKFLTELNNQHQKELLEQQQQQQQEQEQENLKKGISSAEPQLEPTRQEIKATPVQGYKAVKVVEVEEPPSPKVAACGFCSAFGRSPAKKPATKAPIIR